MRPFEIFDQMNQADEANKTSLVAISPSMVEAKTAKGGGHVTMGVPAEVITQLLTGDRKAVLLVFDKKEYDRIDNSTIKAGIELIAKERQEQIEKHGRSIELDIKINANEQLSEAAGWLCYNEQGCADLDDVIEDHCPDGWDQELWTKMCRKPFKERLIIAGALIAAEIDRLQHQPTTHAQD